MKIKKNYGGTEEVVITDKKSRTVFGNYAKFHVGKRQWNIPKEEDIQNAGIISLDPYFKQESVAVAQMCVQHQKPYVTIDCTFEEYIAQNAEAVIISHELRNQSYPDADLESIIEKYKEHCKGLIIFTFGEDPLWYARKGEPVKKMAPYPKIPIDTTGAGDAFRSGIIYGFLNAWDDESTLNFASAVAACVCLTIPHTLNAPTLDGILQFMKDH